MKAKRSSTKSDAQRWLVHLRRTADALSDAIVLLDAKGRVHWVNAAAERLLGLQQANARGTHFSEHLGDSELGAWWRRGAHATASDLASPCAGGPRISVTRVPVAADQHVLVARDISTLNRLEQMRRDFVANVSHELRTPLTVIHGYLELLQPADVPQLAPVLDELRIQSRRMGQIVEDLLTLSRLETQTTSGDEHVAMRPLLNTLKREAEALSQGRHHVELAIESEANLIGSNKDLHSAFSNLVSNAVRYTPNQGRIRIGWCDMGSGARYSVIDTGYGIAAEHIARLTERFYRVSSSRSRETGGTGLGLSIVKHVLSLHQAQLEIESAPGAGSSFHCEFPAARVHRGSDAA